MCARARSGDGQVRSRPPTSGRPSTIAATAASTSASVSVRSAPEAAGGTRGSSRRRRAACRGRCRTGARPRSSSPPRRRITASTDAAGGRLGDHDREVAFDLRVAADRGRALRRQPPLRRGPRSRPRPRPRRRRCGAPRRRPIDGCSSPTRACRRPRDLGASRPPRVEHGLARLRPVRRTRRGPSRRASSSSRPFASSRSYGRAGRFQAGGSRRADQGEPEPPPLRAARRRLARSPCRSRTPPRPRCRGEGSCRPRRAGCRAASVRSAEWSRESGFVTRDRRATGLGLVADGRHGARQGEDLEVAGRHERGRHDLGQAGAGERLADRARAPRAARGGTPAWRCRA